MRPASRVALADAAPAGYFSMHCPSTWDGAAIEFHRNVHLSDAVIIGTTSEQATDPSPDLYDYAQTKAATTNYVRSLAKQLASKGIRVNGVAPGPIWTPLPVSGGATMEKLKQFGGQTPIGRLVSRRS